MKKKLLLLITSTLILALGAFLSFNHLKLGSHNEARLPIDFIPYTKQPKTEVIIEGQKYSLMIDLGSSSHLTFRNEILNKMHKTPLREVSNFDIKGNEYLSKAYLLPELKIRNMTFTNIEAISETDNFLEKGSILYDDSEKTKEQVMQDKPGRIGRKLFIDTNANLFLDFRNSLMFVCCHLTDRKKDGYQIAKFVSAPFELDKDAGIIVNIDTDLGIKRFMLDTGCTRSLLKSSIAEKLETKEWKPGLFLWHSSKFSFANLDLCSLDLLLVEIAPILSKIDGMIGMDVLKNHVVYIDFQNKLIYFAKSDDCLPTHKISWLKTFKGNCSEMKHRVQEFFHSYLGGIS